MYIIFCHYLCVVSCNAERNTFWTWNGLQQDEKTLQGHVKLVPENLSTLMYS